MDGKPTEANVAGDPSNQGGILLMGSIANASPISEFDVKCSASSNESDTRTIDGRDGGRFSETELPPPLPRRPSSAQVSSPIASPISSPISSRNKRSQLQAQATTAVSLTDIHTHSNPDGSRETYVDLEEGQPGTSHHHGTILSRHYSPSTSLGDSASVISFVPTVGGYAESLLGDVLGDGQHPSWNTPYHSSKLDSLADTALDDSGSLVDFNAEFDDLVEINERNSSDTNEGELLSQWRSKLKHFLILSSAGKPIYSRHGSDNLICGYIGVVQTIISFYEGATNQLRGFTTGKVRFVVLTRGPLHLVAISKLGESESQLRVQLEALYMQILSTLTLPTLINLFSNRPSTDLRRPLQGTDTLLSALADSFTRGSPSSLLSALECLKLRKTHRQNISNAMLKARCSSLLYGLIVAGGRLVSVVRPRSHSLHPSDLQLIFNMLFEAGGIKAGGGENWIPMCLPAFNKNGYLYMYVSFVETNEEDTPSRTNGTEDQIAILLISAEKESFYDLRSMRDSVLEDLEKTGSLAIIREAVLRGRPTTTDIIPGTVLRHFLYKSRGNLQYVMPSYEPDFTTLLGRRRLISLYHALHASVHSKTVHLKVHYCVSRDFFALAWVTPLFELFCVASPNVPRNALAQSANKVVQWVRREEERIFIIGGAVF